MELTTTIKSEHNLICRICLTESDNNKNLNFSMFEYCTGIDTSETPQSTQICYKCESSLNDFYLFKEKCVKSHDSLLKMYRNISESLDIAANAYKNEPFEESNVDEYQLSEEEAENTQAEEEELVEVFMLCEEKDKISNDSSMDENEMESDVSNFEYPKLKKIKTKNLPGNKIDRLICPYCGQKHSLGYMKTHIRNAHSTLSEQQRFECDICKNTYKNKESLKCHKRKHSDLVYTCKICDKGFKNWCTRRSHMSVSHGFPSRYNCTICDYKTNNSDRFSAHKRQHTGELPFECNECQKKFITQRNLTHHMVSHSNEKNFICEYCNKAFKGLKHLKAHIKIHTQERNYVCYVESCGKTFIQNHVLKSHMKTNHPEVEIPPSGTVVSKRYKNVTVIPK